MQSLPFKTEFGMPSSITVVLSSFSMFNIQIVMLQRAVGMKLFMSQKCLRYCEQIFKFFLHFFFYNLTICQLMVPFKCALQVWID